MRISIDLLERALSDHLALFSSVQGWFFPLFQTSNAHRALPSTAGCPALVAPDAYEHAHEPVYRAPGCPLQMTTATRTQLITTSGVAHSGPRLAWIIHEGLGMMAVEFRASCGSTVAANSTDY